MSKSTLSAQSLPLCALLLLLYYFASQYLRQRWGVWGLDFAQLGLLLLPSLMLARLDSPHLSKDLPLRPPRVVALAWTLILSALVIRCGEAMIDYQELNWPMPERYERHYSALTQNIDLFHFLSYAVIPALCEEFFFRGYLQSALRQRYRRTWAVLLTAVLFAVVHFNPWRLSYYLLLGIFLSLLRERWNNLFYCMLAHFLNNLYSLYLG